MSITSVIVTSAAGLQAVVKDSSVDEIIVTVPLEGVKSLCLSPGQTLRSEGEGIALHFEADQDGIELSSDNTLRDIVLMTGPGKRAIFNIPDRQPGQLTIGNVTVCGRVELLSRVPGDGFVAIDGLTIVQADTRDAVAPGTLDGEPVRAAALTLWNGREDGRWRGSLADIKIGSEARPVLASGILLGGEGGGVKLSQLGTGELFCHNEPDARSTGGALLVAAGASIGQWRADGRIESTGERCLAAGNWGDIGTARLSGTLITEGSHAPALSNHGKWRELEVRAPLETRGAFSGGVLHTGTMTFATLDHVCTQGTGSDGVRIEGHLGHFVLRRGLSTRGGNGEEQTEAPQPSHGIAIGQDAAVFTLTVEGGIRTASPDCLPLDIRGRVGRLSIDGGLTTGQD
ncbi:hypothetical protein [Paludibacterium paludis]|uniref:Uncharacterized protein n=1 Tax=Paludibacterium paludis TaxID=1225769 RepID=A0A918P363_9NEIS|nr:hypothetical protein [Paludibacterium paludis]GGY17562.1 hypothetical protein GCM10011289_21290 [Paludibacterium paludis]